MRLLSQVAINYHRKNGVGHFFSPSHTFIDTAFLGTVPLADIRSACGEIMKAALIHDARLYELMDAHGEDLIAERFQHSPEAARVIKLSIDAMLECIGPDLWEEALLRPMDFGHSFSRTLETDERFQLRHGEAVAIDCVMNSLIAEVKGLDTWLPGAGFRLLFGTPFFSTTLDGAERMNEELAALIDREQASAVASQQQRSMSGGSSFRTDDHFLTRTLQQVAKRELAGGLAQLSGASRIFYDIYDRLEPASASSRLSRTGLEPLPTGVHVSESYDATSHFETAVEDVLAMYKSIMGCELDLDGTAL